MAESNVIDITEDGGVLKEIKTPGAGDLTPSTGCKVKVHYTGTLLDGTVFDSSKTRGEPFEFDLGKGQVIKAWDRGIATMKKDEVAVFTCKPEYAYGKQGSPPTIPADATLVFEVEMISWESEDISPVRDGGIRREVLVEGGSFSTPKEGANVEITIKAEYDGKTFHEGNFNFILGEGSELDLPDSVEKALEKFKLKEQSRLLIQPKYLWGGGGNEKLGLPKDTPAVYTVTLNNFEKVKDAWQLNADEKLEQGKLLKERGTNYFKADKFDLSRKNYEKAIPYLDHDVGFEGDQEVERKKLLTACHLNAAMSLLKLKQARPAKDHCDKAIELDPNNEKAFFRRGNAYLDLNEPELAEKDFVKVLHIDPNNKAAVQRLAQTKQKLKEQKQREKQVYANMFDKFAKHDTEAQWRFGWWKGNDVEVEKEEFVETEEDMEEERKLKKKQKEYFMKKAAEMRAKRDQMLKEKGEIDENAEKKDDDKDKEERDGFKSDGDIEESKDKQEIVKDDKEKGLEVSKTDDKHVENETRDTNIEKVPNGDSVNSDEKIIHSSEKTKGDQKNVKSQDKEGMVKSKNVKGSQQASKTQTQNKKLTNESKVSKGSENKSLKESEKTSLKAETKSGKKEGEPQNKPIVNDTRKEIVEKTENNVKPKPVPTPSGNVAAKTKDNKSVGGNRNQINCTKNQDNKGQTESKQQSKKSNMKKK